MKHTFAIYYADADKLTAQFKLTDKDLVRRLSTILRLQHDEIITLFNRTHHTLATITAIDKKFITMRVGTLEKNGMIVPMITMLLPLLKREAFDEAVYNLVQAGVSVIQPVITDNVHRAWGGQKEMDRLERLVIAAAEQSKNFAFPLIQPPIPLSQAIEQAQGTSLYADPQGDHFLAVVDTIKAAKPDHINLLIGPEADLSLQEKERIASKGYLFFRLTPTILRAREAAFLSAALIRSCL